MNSIKQNKKNHSMKFIFQNTNIWELNFLFYFLMAEQNNYICYISPLWNPLSYQISTGLFVFRKNQLFLSVLWGDQEFDVFLQVTSQGSERVYSLNRNHWCPHSPARLCCGLSVFQTCRQEPWLVNPFATCFSWPTTIGTSVVLPHLLLEDSIT